MYSLAQQYLAKLNDDLKSNFRQQLEECFISVASLVDFSCLKDGAIMDLDFLNPVRLLESEESFLPKKIYVRNCMKLIFGWFCEDTRDERCKPGNVRTVLLGSPGVGKSVLLFLAALYQAQSSYIVYYRHTTIGKHNSIFLMVPDQDNFVRVWFTRKLHRVILPHGFSSFHRLLLRFSKDRGGELHDKSLYTFVDGPDVSDKMNMLDDTYDYFCTSEVHHLPIQEQEVTFRRWVLNGWTEDEAIDGVQAVSNQPEETAKRAYELCGGSMRNILRVCRSDKEYAIVKKYIDSLMSRLTVKHKKRAVVVARWWTETSEQLLSFDRVCTMFRQEKANFALQLVDSKYILHELRRKIAWSRWFDGYRWASSVLDGTLEGLYFEKCIHKWFDEEKPTPIKDVCWSTGTTIDGLRQFRASNEYWIPSVSNFPNIDSAVVVNDKLYALQITCTKSKKQKFDAKHFLDNVVYTVRASFPTLKENVNIIFLVPGDSVVSLPPRNHDNITYSLQHVDMTSERLFNQSMRLLPFLGP